MAKTFVVNSTAWTAMCVFSLALSSDGQQIQREWVRNYALAPAKLNQAGAIKICPDGNIVVAGTSYNPAGNADYFVIKYSPAGETLWTLRHNFPGGVDDVFRSMALDPAGNIFVTGTTQTIKINPMGGLVWASPFQGRAVVANAEFVYITGSSDVDIVTRKLENNDTDGRELWNRVIDDSWHNTDIGTAIALDATGDIYVAGNQMVDCLGSRCLPIFGLAIARYGPDGTQKWYRSGGGCGGYTPYPSSIVIAPDGAMHLFGNIRCIGMYQKFDTYGFPVHQGNGPGWQTGNAMVYDPSDNSVLLTGERIRAELFPHSVDYEESFLSKIPPEPAFPQWIIGYQGPNGGYTEGFAVALDPSGYVYVAGS